MNRLAHGLEAGEMNDRIDIMLVEYGTGIRLVAQIRLDEGDGFTRDFLHPLDSRVLTVAQVVQDDDLVARPEQLDIGMGADITGAPVTNTFLIVFMGRDYSP